MKKHLEQIKTKWIRLISFAFLFALTPVITEYWFLKATDVSYWVWYTETLVQEEVNFEDDTIEILSFAEIKRPVLIEWNDALFCKNGTGYKFVASNQNSRYFQKPITLPRIDLDGEKTETLIPWRFDTKGRLQPNEECYIESTITAKLRFGINKYQTIRSNTFTIND